VAVVILFLVSRQKPLDDGRKKHVLTFQDGREQAKRAAHPHLLGNPDKYIVTPVTTSGDQVTFALGGAWIQT
jgi:hypothetical protein